MGRLDRSWTRLAKRWNTHKLRRGWPRSRVDRRWKRRRLDCRYTRNRLDRRGKRSRLDRRWKRTIYSRDGVLHFVPAFRPKLEHLWKVRGTISGEVHCEGCVTRYGLVVLWQ